MQLDLLAHHQRPIAKEIWSVWQRSYQIEANLLGMEDFPPLQRQLEEIMASERQFVGLRHGQSLAALSEFSILGGELEISSLVVDPAYFRRGIASRLMQYLLSQNAWTEAIVDTAQANHPAIALYQKWGFEIVKSWQSRYGIYMVRLARSCKLS